MFADAVNLNHKNIKKLLEINPKALYIDLGCDDGKISTEFAQKIATKNIYGADIVESRLAQAKKIKINIVKQDLNQKFNLNNNYFDAVTANQVIEHIGNSDNFLAEIYRILKLGGYAIISTENASSWCNIGASLMGWQIFSLTNFSSKKRSIGNPYSIHREEGVDLNSWQHVRIYNIFGLKEYFESYGFKVEKIMGAGYFPFPASFGKWDIIHSHFITFKIRKVKL
jgi:2-polyprenyl-3-methyl-5-hydroxy-6-metoxy-1,4-benzoquinol methylase